MKTLLKKMFTGWMLREASWIVPPTPGEGFPLNEPYYSKTEEQAMIEACGGNVIEGNLLVLFSHWSNDIQALAPYYGIYLDRDEDGKLFIREDIPPAPSPEHWWNDNAWQEPEDTNGAELDAISQHGDNS